VLAHGVDEAFEVDGDTEQALLRAIEQSRRALFASHASVAGTQDQVRGFLRIAAATVRCVSVDGPIAYPPGPRSRCL
jgi:hypothetical protein